MNSADGAQQESSVELSGHDRVSRYLFSGRHYAATRGLVKTGAFDPSPHLQLSVGHTTGLDDSVVWELGEIVRQHTGRPKLHARADVSVAAIQRNNLRAVRDDTPFGRHTNVIGWPIVENDDERKRIWKTLATLLADQASLHIHPSS